MKQKNKWSRAERLALIAVVLAAIQTVLAIIALLL